MNTSKKIWYVAASINGFNKYTYIENKNKATQLCKNLQKLFPNRIMFWVDFQWKSSINKYPGSVLHGNSFTETKTLIKDCGIYVENYMISSLN